MSEIKKKNIRDLLGSFTNVGWSDKQAATNADVFFRKDVIFWKTVKLELKTDNKLKTYTRIISFHCRTM